jgi:hypothetical protein
MKPLEKLRRILFAEGGLPIVWVALTVAVLIPVWHQRLLPMLDTPNHLALVRGWHSFHDPAFKISDFYVLRVRPVPYFLFYLSIHLLMYLFNIEVANKVFLSAYLILFPLSVLTLARALRRSPWLALGAFPLCFNQNWIYGFSSYLMGTACMFFSYALLIRHLTGERRWQDAALLGVSTVLAYFSHVMTWFCFGVGAIGLLILHRRRWRRGLWAALAMLPSCALAILAWVQERADHSYMKHGNDFAGQWRDFPTSVMEFPRRVLEIIPGHLDTIILIVLVATTLGLVLWRGTHQPGDDETERKQLKLILILLGLTYITLPYQILRPMAWWYVAPRVPSMMAPFLLVLPAGRIFGKQRLIMLPTIVCAIVLPVKLARLYRDFSNRNAPFMKLVSEIPDGSKTMVVVRGMMRGPGSEEKSGDPATSAPVYWHFSSWPMALHGGYDPYIFDQGIPIRPKVIIKAPPWANVDTFDIRQAPDFDYYLVRSPLEIMDREPSLSIVDSVGDWTLYKRVFKGTEEP